MFRKCVTHYFRRMLAQDLKPTGSPSTFRWKAFDRLRKNFVEYPVLPISAVRATLTRLLDFILKDNFVGISILT